MTDYSHKYVPTVAAPPALGQARKVTWDIYRDAHKNILPIAFTPYDNCGGNLVLSAVNWSWPKAGGRAIVVHGTPFEMGEGVECWTEAQVGAELGRHLFATLLRIERIAKRVWANPLRADPAPWPNTPPLPLKL